MVSPLVNAAQHFVAPITKALTRVVTPPGLGGGPTPEAAAPPVVNLPQPLQPAQQPVQKPTGHGGGAQQTFLAGAAQFAGTGGGGNTGGKTLLGQ